MKLLPNNTLNTVLLSCALLFTVNVSAQEVSLEQSLAATVKAQGKKAAQDLSAELSNSIKAELQRFSMRYTKVKSQALASTAQQEKLVQQKTKTSDE
ncbi:MAG: hypothetical protein ACPG52_04145 [Cognaticolwellia sp.]